MTSAEGTAVPAPTDFADNPAVEIERVRAETVHDTGAFRWQHRKRVPGRVSRAWRRMRRLGRRILAAAGVASATARLAPSHPPRVNPRFIRERHHHHYGRPWCLGRDQFDCLVDSGLEPHHRLLDLGCGALRTGVWAIPYLDADRYFGIDAHCRSLEAARSYEIPLHGLEGKRPRLLHSADFRCDHFDVPFDRVLAFSLFNHLSDRKTDAALRRIAGSLAPAGRVLVAKGLKLTDAELRDEYGLRVEDRFETPSKFLKTSIGWVQLAPAPS